MRESDALAERNRERLLDAAVEAFMEAGYQASIDNIVGRAGVVRQTLYNHFQCKDVLFTEAVRRVSADIVVPLTGEPGDVRDALIRFGIAVRTVVLSPRGISMFRVLIAEAPRFAKLAKSAYAEGPGHGHKQLSAFLKKAMQAGHLRKDDAKLAASMLLGMLVNQDRDRCLFGVQEIPACEASEVSNIVDCFLRAFAPEPGVKK